MQTKTSVRGGLSGVLLCLSATVTMAAAPAGKDPARRVNPSIEISRASAERRQPFTPELSERGIKSWGVGATRVDPAPARPQAGGMVAETSSSITPALAGVTRKISGSPMAGRVSAFRVSPDGARVVFIADKDTAGRPELYSVPADGSAAPVKISAGLVFAAGKSGVTAFQIAPNSTLVVFLADPDTTAGVNEIFSAPIDGSSTPVKLNTAGAAPITGLGLTANSAWAVYFGVDTTTASGAVEVYRADVATAGSGVQISRVGQQNPAGDVVAASFSPNSARIVYTADGGVDGVFQIYSVPTSATGPGSEVLLSASLGMADLVRISPDSSMVAFTSDASTLGKMEVFSIPIAGGTRVKLNPSMAGDGATSVEISPDGTRVAYLADQATTGVNEVWSAQMNVASSGVRLNTPMASPQYADTLEVSPESSTAVYEADQVTPGTYNLYRVPIVPGGAPMALHAVTSPDSVGSFLDVGTPIIGRRVVYPVFGMAVNLFSVPFDGSAAPAQINPAPAAGDRLFNAFLPTIARRLVAYGAGPSSGSITRKVTAAAIRSDLPAEQVNVTATGTSGVLGYEIGSSEAYAVYLQDQDTSGKPELYSRELDSDGDAVINATDNCPFVANPSQSPLVFPANVTALNNTTFIWGSALDVRYVRGPIVLPPTYATNLSGTLVESTGLVDTALPAVGTGWFYMFAIDCPGRSYQTTVGAEPGRDLAALP